MICAIRSYANRWGLFILVLFVHWQVKVRWVHVAHISSFRLVTTQRKFNWTIVIQNLFHFSGLSFLVKSFCFSIDRSFVFFLNFINTFRFYSKKNFILIWIIRLFWCRCFLFRKFQLERAYQPELMVFVVMLTISTILYAISGYLKAVILCFKLKGPPAHLFIGNILAINDKDRK